MTGIALVSQISWSRDMPKCLKMSVNKLEYGRRAGCMIELTLAIYPKEVTSEVNWLARHKEIYEFEGFVVETMSRVGIW